MSGSGCQGCYSFRSNRCAQTLLVLSKSCARSGCQVHTRTRPPAQQIAASMSDTASEAGSDKELDLSNVRPPIPASDRNATSCRSQATARSLSRASDQNEFIHVTPQWPLLPSDSAATKQSFVCAVRCTHKVQDRCRDREQCASLP